MNGVEAAASLFGSDDAVSSSDPFASLGEQTSSYSTPDVPFSGAVASKLFESNSFENDGGISQPESSTPDVNGNSVTQSSMSSTGVDLFGSGVSHEAPVWSYSNGQESDANVYHDNGSQYSQQNGYTYDSYPPPSHHEAPRQTAHNYTPLDRNPSTTYTTASQPISSTYQTHDPYAPASNTTFQYTPSYVVSSHSREVKSPANVSPISSAPPPPPVVTEVSRPKVANAYDPPFATLKPSTSRRNMSKRNDFNQHSLPDTYNLYSQPMQPVSSAGQHYPSRQGSAGYDIQAVYSQDPGNANHQYQPNAHMYKEAVPNPSSISPVNNLPASPPVHTHDSNVTGQFLSSSEVYPEHNYMPYEKPLNAEVLSNTDIYGASVSGYGQSSPDILSTSTSYASGQDNSSPPPTHAAGSIMTSGSTSPGKPSSPRSHPFDGVSSFSQAISSNENYHIGSPDKIPTVDEKRYAPVSTSPPPKQLGLSSPPTGQSNLASSSSWQSSNYLPQSTSEENGSTPFHGPQKISDPYLPKGSQFTKLNGERATSPAASLKSLDGRRSTKPYNPKVRNSPSPDITTARSVAYASMSAGVEDPYAPSNVAKTNRATWGSDSSIRTNKSYAEESALLQEITTKPFSTPYAPSPSLIGANDPLGRTSSRAPTLSFGFGGKLVTCFHRAAELNTGYDVALSSRNSTSIHIRALNNLIPVSALEITGASFPGPLIPDSSTPITNLVRTGTSGAVKTKKTAVIKYLKDRINEIARGLAYMHSGSRNKRTAEDKLILVKLLQILVENDGRLSGTSELDTAVRVALVPRLEDIIAVTSSPPGPGFSNLIPDQSLIHQVSPALYSTSSTSLTSNETPLSTATLQASSLEHIESLLLSGERQKAYHYALDQKLWAHAMVIASSIDKEAWKEVVNEFLATELGGKSDSAAGTSERNKYESLRVAYSLYSGQGAASVQELVPKSLLAQVPGPLGTATGQPIPTASPDSYSRWAETVAMMLSSTPIQETSAALTALGDQLLSAQWVEAAHACYLLSPQTSLLGGVGAPSIRVTLLGSPSPQLTPNFSKDEGPFIFSEILEFALSLVPVGKNQEAFVCLPHMQAYRFIRAMSLAEYGEIQLASRYCEAITASLGRGSPYFNVVLLEQLRGLSDRINGVSHGDKSNSWITGKLSKPSLDTIGGWLEGRFTKLVTGDADGVINGEAEVAKKAEEISLQGPFAHYSTISSTTSSARSSPQPSPQNNFTITQTASLSGISSYTPYQMDNTSLGHARNNMSPGPYGPYAANASDPLVSSGTNHINTMGNGESHRNSEEDKNPSWWSSSLYNESSSVRTPTATTFMQVDHEVPASDGFISLMDNHHSFSAGPVHQPQRQNTLSSRHGDDDEVEDLGFGNSKRDKKEETVQDAETPVETPKATPVQPQSSNDPEAAPAGGSWLSRWWKGSGSSTPGPVKASLGEESTFYYDKDLKRWVNKKAGAEEAAKPNAPPPPPSRSQTASPGMPKTGAVPGVGAPPTRSASAIDLTTSPPSRSTMRVRSNLVPPPESAPSTPTGTRLGPQGPPPGRPKSQASKRNIRNRYVDVFQDGSGGA